MVPREKGSLFREYGGMGDSEKIFTALLQLTA